MKDNRLFLLEAEDFLEGNPARLDFGRAIIKPPLPAVLEEQLTSYTSQGDWSDYGSWKGLSELREKIAQIHSPYRKGGVVPEQVIVTHGATGARQLYFELRKPRVGVKKPYFFDYARIPGLRFIDELDDELDALFISNPHNPLGISLTQAELDNLEDITKERGIDLVIDAAYRGFELDEKKYCVPNTTWEFVSVGKSLGMTDLRVGALIIPKTKSYHDPTMRALHDIQNDRIIALSQHEQRRALDKLRYLETFQEHAREHLRVMDEVIKNVFSFEYASGGDAGIHFLRYDDCRDSREVAWNFLREHGIYLMPGDDFGMPKHVRVCLGGSNAQYVNELAYAFGEIVR